MSPMERKSRRLLSEFVRLFEQAEKCNHCIPPAMGLDPCHLKKYDQLVEEARKFLASGPN